VRQALNTVENWLFNLRGGPFAPIAAVWEGALLLIRRHLFNQAPQVVPSQQTTSELDGTIGGRIGAYDLEGDALTYTVVVDPEWGTIEIDDFGSYAYTAGEGFAGTDSFTVKISPPTRSLNLADLGSDGSREVTINIGEQTFVDTPDIAVGLFDASGRLTVTRSALGEFTGTVTLSDVDAASEWTWLDTSGQFGGVSTEHVEAFWPVFEAKSTDNGASVDLTLSYTGVDGSGHTVLLNNVDLSESDGRYTITGQLAPDTDADPDGVDNWDILGKDREPEFDNFRSALNLEAGADATSRGLLSPPNSVEFAFTEAEVFIDTLTPLSYSKAGLYAMDSEAQPPAVAEGAAVAQTAGLTNLAAVSANAVAATSAVTASLALGRSTVIGRADGSVEVWTDGEMEQLQDTGWKAAVTQLIEYNRPLKDDQGNTIDSTFTGYIQGTTLTVTNLGAGSTVKVGSVITGEGVAPGTTITKFIEQTEQCADEACTATILKGAGGSNGYTGTYEVSIAQTVGGPTQSADSTLPPGITLTQTGVPAISPGFVAGLEFGSIQYYQPTTGWVELRGQSAVFKVAGVENTDDVTALAAFGDSIVVGTEGGWVDVWTPPDAASDPATWKDNWTQLHGPNDDGHLTSRWRNPSFGWVTLSPGFDVGYEPVTAIVEVGSPATPDHGIVVAWGMDPSGCAECSQVSRIRPGLTGLIDAGNVSFWDPESGWTDLTDLGLRTTAMTAYGDGVAVGLKNGAVHYWDGTVAAESGWTQLQDSGWGQEVSTMLPYDQGLIVGLGAPGQSGGVEYYTGGTDYQSGDWIELRGVEWGSAVTQMINYRSDSRGDGVVVGLANGSVQMWNGPLERPANATDTLRAGQSLTLGETLYSNDGSSTLTLQTDGNLVLRRMGSGIWASGTFGQGVVEARLQAEDGNFVLYNASGQSVAGTGQNGAPIPTATSGQDVRLVVQGDGNVVIYNGEDTKLWATNTRQEVALPQPEWRWWTELHNSVWDAFTPQSGVAALVPVSLSTDDAPGDVVFQDGIIVGLGNGALEQWSGGGDLIAGYQSAWTEIASGLGKNYAAAALSRKEAFECSDWQCSQEGALKDAVEFVTAIKTGQSSAKIRGADDPIFSDPMLQAAGSNGTYQTLAYYQKISPEDANYAYPKPTSFKGYIKKGAEASDLAVLMAKKGTPTLKNGWLVTNTGATIVRYLGTDGFYDMYELSGGALTRSVGGEGKDEVNITVSTTPAIKAGFDVIPVAYGYAFVPDGFLPKFSSGNWSYGFLAAAGVGGSVDITLGDKQGALQGPQKDLVSKEWYGVTPYGTYAFDIGVNLGASLTFNGLAEKPTVGAHAWMFGGMLATSNTVGSPGREQFGFNWYPDISAREFKDLSGATATITLNPYANLLYGLFLPKSLPVVGGWSLVKLSTGYENPIYASVCVDATGSCPTAEGSGSSGATASVTIGSNGLWTAHAGLLEQWSKKLTYDMKVPLYDVDTVLKLV